MQPRNSGGGNSEIPPPDYRQDRLGLCLSGGGFRACLFHLGAVEFLYRAGVLDKVKYLSTVSGGSVLGAWIALHWSELLTAGDRQQTFENVIAKPILKLASKDLRNRVLRRGWVRPASWFRSRGDNLAEALDDLLYKGRRLNSLPDSSELRIAINATSIRSGKRFRFSRDSLGDYHTGYVPVPVGLRVATAVGSSAAFPPVFSPVVVPFEGPIQRWTFDRPPQPLEPLEPLPEGCVALTDGGVYDNLGIQAATQRCGRIIAIDAGLPLNVALPFPERGLLQRWLAKTGSNLRAVDILMSRTTSLLSSQFVKHLLRGKKEGCLIRIDRTVDYVATVEAGSVPPLASHVGLSQEDANRLAVLRTDFDRFSPLESALLRFHGYSLTAASVARFQPSLLEGQPDGKEQPELTDWQRKALSNGSVRTVASLLRFWEGF